MPEPLIFVATHDIAGRTRGKAFPAADRALRLTRGLGWTPTNVQITCFDVIADSPFGALGDLLLLPDAATEVKLADPGGGPDEHFMLGDILTTEGTPWACCTRAILRGALDRLNRVAGLTLHGAFEHEFQLTPGGTGPGWAYTLDGFRAQAGLLGDLMGAMRATGLDPDTIMKEYGPDQYEVTMGPATGVTIADQSTILRELTRTIARRHGEVASFTPIRDPASVGNGAHIHMSFSDAAGDPATHDPDGPCGMSALTGSFIAGILKYLDRILAFTAPSVISYARLTPHRWSAAYNNLGFRDREAAVRICPVTARDPKAIARQYHFEYRAGDSAAAPHLALAAIVHAGVQGIEEGLPPPPASEEDLSLLDAATLADRGYLRLPETLGAALDRLEASETVAGWFPEGFLPVYLAHKRFEAAHVAGMAPAEVHALYGSVY